MMYVHDMLIEKKPRKGRGNELFITLVPEFYCDKITISLRLTRGLREASDPCL